MSEYEVDNQFTSSLPTDGMEVEEKEYDDLSETGKMSIDEVRAAMEQMYPGSTRPRSISPGDTVLVMSIDGREAKVVHCADVGDDSWVFVMMGTNGGTRRPVGFRPSELKLK